MKSHIFEIEQKLLAAYIQNQDLFVKCQHLVSDKLWSKGINRACYALIKKFHESNIKPEINLLFSNLKKMQFPPKECAQVSAMASADYSFLSQPEQYVEILFRNYVAEYLMPVLMDSYTKLSSETGDSLEIMSFVKDAITNVELVLNNVSKEKSIFDVFEAAIQRIKDLKNNIVEQNGFSFGLKNLDERTGGICQGINIIGASPGSGKTSALINIIVKNAIYDNNPIIFFSLEMSAVEIATNIIANFFEINSRSLRSGDVDDGQIMSIETIKTRLKDNLIIDDTGGISWQYIESKLRHFRKKHKIPLNKPILAMIDYLQLMINTPDEWKGTNEEQRISITCNQLARICKNENIATILLSQLNRPDKERKNPRPKMSDLKGSGAIEACAILIILLFRPDYNGIIRDDDGRDLRGLCEINPVKGRYIKPEPVYARFIGKYSKFEDYNMDDAIINSTDPTF